MPKLKGPENSSGARVKWRSREVKSRKSYFGQVIYQPGGYCGWRVQRGYQLVVVHSGECRVTVGRKERDIPIGCVALFKPGHTELFRFSTTQETRHSWCSVEARAVSREMRKALERAPPQVTMTALFERVLNAALELGTAERSTHAAVLDHLALSLFSEYLWCGQNVKQVQPLDRVVIAVQRYLNDHFGERDCLLHACAVAACSRSALIRKFQQGLGETPGRYLWQIRVEKGIGMLRNTGLTMSEISDICGFSNPYHFSRRIKAAAGASPRSVRKTAWGR
jgi:AraC-like DNA-binding protein